MTWITPGVDGKNVRLLLSVMRLTSKAGDAGYILEMRTFAILNTRKRALIALIHAVAFLGLAIRDFAVSSGISGSLAGGAGRARSLIFAVVYLIVTSVLAYLLRISKGMPEQLYFAFCTASASTGLLRALVGDSAFVAGQYLRMGLLACAVVAGIYIAKLHSPAAVRISEVCAAAEESPES